LVPRKFPYAVTITSRGCPYRCIFCAASTVSGRKIRFRSANNVLNEIDMLYQAGIREIIFLDDHFLGNRKRAVEIMRAFEWGRINFSTAERRETVARMGGFPSKNWNNGGLILAANAVLMFLRKYKHINIFDSKTLTSPYML